MGDINPLRSGCGRAESLPAHGPQSPAFTEYLSWLCGKVDLQSGRMTNPSAKQNKEIDCLSPEAQRLVRGKRISRLSVLTANLVLVDGRPAPLATGVCAW